MYPGANTTLTFENGSTAFYTTTAVVVGDFTNVTDGESFYQTFCTGLTPTVPVATNTTNTTVTPFPPGGTPNSTAQPFGFPKPLVVSSDLQVSGYFLNDSDVAVLSMVSFERMLSLLIFRLRTLSIKRNFHAHILPIVKSCTLLTANSRLPGRIPSRRANATQRSQSRRQNQTSNRPLRERRRYNPPRLRHIPTTLPPNCARRIHTIPRQPNHASNGTRILISNTL